MINQDIEKYYENGVYVSPINGKKYHSKKGFKQHLHYNSKEYIAKKGKRKPPVFVENMHKCTYCEKEISSRGVKNHEKSCYLNPKNLKLCKICNNPIKNYKTSKGACSTSCANKLFKNRIKDDRLNYRTLCFRYHEKKCVICGEDKIVAVHHYDHNHKNNGVDNLVPLCPTHHQYVHSAYHDEVIEKIDDYLHGWRIQQNNKENQTLH